MRHRPFIFIAVCLGIAVVAPLSAQVTAKFRAEREQLLQSGRALQRAQGLSERDMLDIPLRTPFTGAAPRIQTVLPGGSLTVTVQGDFGCAEARLKEKGGGLVEGHIACGTNFYDGVLNVAGTMTQLQ